MWVHPLCIRSDETLDADFREIEMRRHPARDAVVLENGHLMAGFCRVIGGGEPHSAAPMMVTLRAVTIVSC